MGTTDPGGLLFGALLMNIGMKGRENPCPCTLMPVVFLCSVFVSCSSSQAAAYHSPCISPFPGSVPLSLGSLVETLLVLVEPELLALSILALPKKVAKYLPCFSSSSSGIIPSYSSSSKLHPLQRLSHKILYLPGGRE